MEQDLILKLEDVQAGQASGDRFQHLTLGLSRAEILAVMSSRAYDLNNLIELLNMHLIHNFFFVFCVQNSCIEQSV